MKKFLQKYKNYIMAIVSVLLMFAFGLPGLTPGSKAGTGNSAPAGYLDGHKVTIDQTNGYRGELSMLRDFGFLDSQGGTTWVERLWLEQGGAADDVGVYWFVLNQEASRYMTITVGPDEAVKDATQGGMSESQVIDKLDHNYKVSKATLALAVSHLYTVQRYLNFMESFAQPISAKELLADRELRRLTVDYVPIDAARDWRKLSEDAVKDQLTRQYEAYKNLVRTDIPGPQDPPIFLGLEKDEKGDYALLGYPGSVASPAHVHEGESIAWDGSRVDKIYRQGDIIGFDGSNFVRAPATMLVLKGPGRAAGTPIGMGQDIHDKAPPAYPPEINGHHFPFGYKFPDRVKVEYLKFARVPLRGRLEVSAADVEAALKVFQADPYKFRARPTTAPAVSVSVAAPGATVPAASQPVERSPEQLLSDWDDPAVKKPYLEDQLNLRSASLLKKLVDAARAKADVPWKKPTSPERSEWVDYRALAEATSRDSALRKGRISGMRRWFEGVGFGGYVPAVETSGAEFLDAAQLQNLPGIGHAIYTTSQTAVFDFPTLASNILELVTPDKNKPLGRMSLQMGHECPEVTDAEGNVYLFRVTDFEKAHVPASLDLVRAQVLEDCKKLAAYTRVVEEIKAALAKAPDLAALAKQYESQLRSPMEFNRDESAAPADVQNIHGFVKAAFELPDPKETNKPSVTALENEQSLMVYPLQVTHNFPANGPDFITELNQGFFNRQPDPAVSTFAQKYLSYKALAGRVNFTLPPGGSWPTRPTPASAPQP